MTANLFQLGTGIYDLKKPSEKRRWYAYLARSFLHYPGANALYRWFLSDPQRREIIERYPFLIEQAERKFFFAGASFRQRCELIRAHVATMLEKFRPEVARDLCCATGRYPLWRSPDEGVAWTVQLLHSAGNRKEGLLTLGMFYGETTLYQMMVWLGPDGRGEPSLFIGAMQGPNEEDSLGLIRETTKRAHAYRTKNLILYITMAFARALGARRLYAVSFKGYYAYARRDHKLQTDLDAFWQEAGGRLTEDPRFYELPLVSPRKSIEEVPSKKRAAYRRRFALLDDADAQVAAGAAALFKR